MALDTLVIFGIILCVTQPVTIIANLLTIIAFFKISNLQMHKSNLLIFVLSMVDFTSGVYQLLYVGIPFTFSLGPPLGEIGCKMTALLEYTYYAGNYLLVAISIDRVLLVSMDYSRYLKMMTSTHLKVTTGICFLICYMAAILEMSLWNYAKRNNANAANISFKEACYYPTRQLKWFNIYLSVCFYYIPLFLVGILSIIFVKRLLIRLNKNRRIGPAHQNSDNNSNENPNEISGPCENQAHQYDTAKKRYIKPAITLAALVLAMCVSMVPYCTYLVVAALSTNFSSTVVYIMYLNQQLSPFLDPLFFAATQKDIREFYGNKIRAVFRTFCNPN